MSKTLLFTGFLVLAIFAASPSLLLKFILYSDDIFMGVSSAFFGEKNDEVPKDDEIRFVGDVMLARHVETLMARYGSSYPYQNLNRDDMAFWIGNFESTVLDDHKKTEDFKLNFSVDKQHLTALKDFGFTHLSLANNHTFDYGPSGYEETVNNLNNFEVFGNPTTINENSVSYVAFNNLTVGIIGIHATNSNYDLQQLINVVNIMSKNSDVQIAYIHWGNEYELTHNSFQSKFAAELIGEGIDAIIGHHPHVVQDIEIIENKPVFYSLGNFIFDQYFNEEVQTGLVLSLTVDNKFLYFELIPVSTKEQTAAPKLMNEDAKIFLKRLAERSDDSIYLDILSRKITIEY